jgi:mannobiose 2-epimerase
MINEIKDNLLNCISPFWKRLKDEQGGFYGYMDFDLKCDKQAPKGVILNSRILWFFSNHYLLFKGDEDLEYAKHAYQFLINRCVDKEYGGVYWMLNADGSPQEEIKHTYNQAFAIYALSSYYDASGDGQALDEAFRLFRLIEERCTDNCGYQEAFDRTWRPIENHKLSDNEHLSSEGVVSEKTMNTLLHVLEAYTELYRVSQNQVVKEKLIHLLQMFRNKVYNPEKELLGVFFDNQLNAIVDMHSYGHDIEATWLLDKACEVLKDQELIGETKDYTLKIAYKVREVAFEKGALNNERFKNEIDKTRVWWVQAEGIVGFINAYEKSKDEKFLTYAEALWTYIKEYMIDKRPGGEWFWQVSLEGAADSQKPIVEPWKCPYHNGRMCFEVIRRSKHV